MNEERETLELSIVIHPGKTPALVMGKMGEQVAIARLNEIIELLFFFCKG